MAELADALASGASIGDDVQVQVLFRAHWGRDFRDPSLLLGDYPELTLEHEQLCESKNSGYPRGLI
jgi:hypothetical protein